MSRIKAYEKQWNTIINLKNVSTKEHWNFLFLQCIFFGILIDMLEGEQFRVLTNPRKLKSLYTGGAMYSLTHFDKHWLYTPHS